MQLYFSPLACSMSARIALYEAGAPAQFTQVDAKTKRTPDGADFTTVNPLGLVPVMRTDDGQLLTENTAILQYVAERFPDAKLVPGDAWARHRLRQWLSFISTELHKAIYIPLLDDKAPAVVKDYTLQKAQKPFAHLSHYLDGREHLLDQFSIGDGYLFTVLNWSSATPIDLKSWPVLHSYYKRMRQRPSISKALDEERALYVEEQERHKAA
jgi:glutathione S-transferase